MNPSINKMKSIQTLLLFILAGRCAVTATITMPESGKQYASVPEPAFQKLTFGVEYLARLQQASDVLNDSYLCRGIDPQMIVPSDSTPGTCLVLTVLCHIFLFDREDKDCLVAVNESNKFADADKANDQLSLT